MHNLLKSLTRGAKPAQNQQKSQVKPDSSGFVVEGLQFFVLPENQGHTKTPCPFSPDKEQAQQLAAAWEKCTSNVVAEVVDQPLHPALPPQPSKSSEYQTQLRGFCSLLLADVCRHVALSCSTQSLDPNLSTQALFPQLMHLRNLGELQQQSTTQFFGHPRSVVAVLTACFIRAIKEISEELFPRAKKHKTSNSSILLSPIDTLGWLPVLRCVCAMSWLPVNRALMSTNRIFESTCDLATSVFVLLSCVVSSEEPLTPDHQGVILQLFELLSICLSIVSDHEELTIDVLRQLPRAFVSNFIQAPNFSLPGSFTTPATQQSPTVQALKLFVNHEDMLASPPLVGVSEVVRTLLDMFSISSNVRRSLRFSFAFFDAYTVAMGVVRVFSSALQARTMTVQCLQDHCGPTTLFSGIGWFEEAEPQTQQTDPTNSMLGVVPPPAAAAQHHFNLQCAILRVLCDAVTADYGRLGPSLITEDLFHVNIKNLMLWTFSRFPTTVPQLRKYFSDSRHRSSMSVLVRTPLSNPTTATSEFAFVTQGPGKGVMLAEVAGLGSKSNDDRLEVPKRLKHFNQNQQVHLLLQLVFSVCSLSIRAAQGLVHVTTSDVPGSPTRPNRARPDLLFQSRDGGPQARDVSINIVCACLQLITCIFENDIRQAAPSRFVASRMCWSVELKYQLLLFTNKIVQSQPWSVAYLKKERIWATFFSAMYFYLPPTGVGELDLLLGEQVVDLQDLILKMIEQVAVFGGDTNEAEIAILAQQLLFLSQGHSSNNNNSTNGPNHQVSDTAHHAADEDNIKSDDEIVINKLIDGSYVHNAISDRNSIVAKIVGCLDRVLRAAPDKTIKSITTACVHSQEDGNPTQIPPLTAIALLVKQQLSEYAQGAANADTDVTARTFALTLYFRIASKEQAAAHILRDAVCFDTLLQLVHHEVVAPLVVDTLATCIRTAGPSHNRKTNRKNNSSNNSSNDDNSDDGGSSGDSHLVGIKQFVDHLANTTNATVAQHLLDCLRLALGGCDAGDRLCLQQLFGTHQVFLQLLLVLMSRVPPNENDKQTVCTLCCSLINTLQTIFCSNVGTKKCFSSSITYSVLQRLIARCLPDSTLTGPVVVALLSLGVEQPFHIPMHLDLLDAQLARLVEHNVSQRQQRTPLAINGEALSTLFHLLAADAAQVVSPLVVDVLKILTCYCQTNSRFCNACVEHGMLTNAIDLFHIVEQQPQAQQQCIALMGVLGGHNTTVKDLHSWFQLLRTPIVQNNAIPSYVVPLLKCLRQMTAHTGPASYFLFSGTKSQLQLPHTIGAVWPGNRGFSVGAWVRVETFDPPVSDVKREWYFPRLWSHCSDDFSYAFEVFFCATTRRLKVVWATPKSVAEGTTQTIVSKTSFKTHQWYHVCVSQGKRGGICLFVDGESDGECEHPVVIALAKPLVHARVGESCFSLSVTTPWARCVRARADSFSTEQGKGIKPWEQLAKDMIVEAVPMSDEEHVVVDVAQCRAFRGDVSTIHYLDEGLTPEAVKQWFSLGKNYHSNFLPIDARQFGQAENSALFDGLVTNHVVAMYCPLSAVDQLVLDNSPESGRVRLDAVESEGVQRCITRSARDIIHCLGGVKVFFPLLAHLDLPFPTASEEDEEILVSETLKTIGDMLTDTTGNQNSMLRCGGFAICNFLLRTVSARMSVSALLGIEKMLDVLECNSLLFRECFMHLLADIRLWMYTPAHVQTAVADAITRRHQQARDIVTPQYILDVLNTVYCTNDSSFNLQASIYLPESRVRQRALDKPEIGRLRTVWLEMLLDLTLEISDVAQLQANASCMLSFLAASNDSLQLVGVVEVFAAVFERRAAHLLALFSSTEPDILVLFQAFKTVLTEAKNCRPPATAVMREKPSFLRFDSGDTDSELTSVNTFTPQPTNHVSSTSSVAIAIDGAHQDTPSTQSTNHSPQLTEFAVVGVLQRVATASDSDSADHEREIFANHEGGLLLVRARTSLLSVIARVHVYQHAKSSLILGSDTTDGMLKELLLQSQDVEPMAREEITLLLCIALGVDPVGHKTFESMEFSSLELRVVSALETVLIAASKNPLLDDRVEVLNLVHELVYRHPDNIATLLKLNNWQKLLLSQFPQPGAPITATATSLSHQSMDSYMHDQAREATDNARQLPQATATPQQSSMARQSGNTVLSAVVNVLSAVISQRLQQATSTTPLLVQTLQAISEGISSQFLQSECAANLFLVLLEHELQLGAVSSKQTRATPANIADLIALAISFAFGALVPPVNQLMGIETGAQLRRTNAGEWRDMRLSETVTKTVLQLNVHPSEGDVVISNLNNELKPQTTQGRNKVWAAAILLVLGLREANDAVVTQCVDSLKHLIVSSQPNGPTKRDTGFLARLFGSVPQTRQEATEISVETSWAMLVKALFLWTNEAMKTQTKKGTAPILLLRWRVLCLFLRWMLREFGAVIYPRLIDQNGTPLIPYAIHADTKDNDQGHAFCEALAKCYLTPEWEYALQTEFQLCAQTILHSENSHHSRVADISFQSLFPDATSTRDWLDDRNLDPVAQWREAEIKRWTKAVQTRTDDDNSVNSKWRHLLRSLHDEQGPWAPPNGQIPVFWKLDKTEDKLRMRRKLRRNYHPIKHRPCSSKPGKNEPAHPEENNTLPTIKLPLMAVEHEDPERAKLEEALLAAEEGTPTADGAQTSSTQAGDETVLVETRAEMVNPLRVYHGKLKITAKHITFTEDKPTDDAHSRSRARKCKRFFVADLQKIHFRRYLLRRTGIELFFNDNTNYFFNLPEKDRHKVFQKLRAATQLTNSKGSITADSVKSPSELFKNLRSEVTERWQNRQISNFEYLMFLNTIAGRSFNDISQYPVFPWVIQDYTSAKLNLEDPATFRDLSKPIGALNQQRLASIVTRYETFEDPDGIIPPFHYGSHYSTGGIVLYYLIRLEPFATAGVELQGGAFDHTDRMFGSIASTWKNVTTNQADVKELIPEFFYLPEFLVNSNNFDFGETQNHERMHDCELPPWASTPHEFVRLNREALESDHVSDNLHLWIDLIFGYKQRGEEAVKAHNVFYYLTYEGAVDIEAVQDAFERRAIEKQIENFGQTPSQLLTRPHPKRKSLDMLMLSIFDRIKLYSPQLSDGLRLYANKQFRSTRDYVHTATLTNLSGSFSLTCSALVESDGSLVYKAVSPKHRDSAVFCLHVHKRKVCVTVFGTLLEPNQEPNPATVVSITGVSDTVANNTWTSIAVVHDAAKHVLVLFVNGREEGRLHVHLHDGELGPVGVGAPCTVVSGSENRAAGKSVNIGGARASIHDLVLHPRKLSSLQIQELASIMIVSRLHPTSGPTDNPPLVFASATPDRLVTVDSSRAICVHRWSATPPNLLAAPFAFEADSLVLQRRKIGIPFSAKCSASPALFSLSPDARMMVSAGHWDNSFKITNLETNRLVGNVYQHRDVVTCIFLSMKGCALVTGSRDTTLMVWWDERGIGNNPSCLERPRNVLYGHDDEVTCVAVDSNLDVVASGSLDSTCVLHTLSRGRYIRTIPHPNKLPVHLVAIASTGEVLVYSKQDFTIFMFSINGDLISKADTEEHISAMCITANGDFVITGGKRAVVVVRALHSLEVVHKTSVPSPISSLCITPEEHHVIVGLSTGVLCICSLTASESRKQSVISSLELLV